MRRVKYYDVTDGEWIRPIKRGYKMMCCDCSLIHRMEFRIVDGTIEYRVFRDERATAAARRGKK